MDQRDITCALLVRRREFASVGRSSRIESDRVGSDQDRSRGKVKGPADDVSVASVSCIERMKLSRGVLDSARTLGKRLSPRRADREEARLHVRWPPLVGASGLRALRAGGALHRLSRQTLCKELNRIWRLPYHNAVWSASRQPAPSRERVARMMACRLPLSGV